MFTLGQFINEPDWKQALLPAALSRCQHACSSSWWTILDRDREQILMSAPEDVLQKESTDGFTTRGWQPGWTLDLLQEGEKSFARSFRQSRTRYGTPGFTPSLFNLPAVSGCRDFGLSPWSCGEAGKFQAGIHAYVRRLESRHERQPAD